MHHLQTDATTKVCGLLRENEKRRERQKGFKKQIMTKEMSVISKQLVKNVKFTSKNISRILVLFSGVYGFAHPYPHLCISKTVLIERPTF